MESRSGLADGLRGGEHRCVRARKTLTSTTISENFALVRQGKREKREDIFSAAAKKGDGNFLFSYLYVRVIIVSNVHNKELNK